LNEFHIGRSPSGLETGDGGVLAAIIDATGNVGHRGARLMADGVNAVRSYLALDLGAESGRAVLGQFDGEQLVCTEVHRFANQPVQLPGALHWDILRIFAEIQAGISSAQQQTRELASVGVDAWGVDFGLLDARGDLLANPVHYRDRRTDGMLDLAERLVGRQRIFESTGIQFLPINTL
jgi:sugar (pentulose or hexulose) kinase